MAKLMLEQEAIEYEEYEITDKADLEREMIERSGRQSVPQIFINDSAIGGFTDLVALADKVDLKALVAGSAE